MRHFECFKWFFIASPLAISSFSANPRLYPCIRPRPASLLHKISLITVFRLERGFAEGGGEVRASQTHR